MLTLLKSLFVLTLNIGRIFIIFKITISLYDNFRTPLNVFNDIQWYVCALILDVYLMNIENQLSSDIYIKKDDGQEINSRDK
jgi:hypothetical protein